MEIDKFVGMIKKTDISLFLGYATVGNLNAKGYAKLKFDGNDNFTEKFYPKLSHVTLYVGNRVLVMGKDNDLIIVGSIDVG